MSKKVVLTGLRANNDLHIGNYFGALLPMIEMANVKAGEYQFNLFVPDLHSITTPINFQDLQNQINHNLRLYVAAGLDLSSPDLFLYRQSYISANSELTVILNNFTGFGEMGRMTQFKDKSAKLLSNRVSVGLFDYPVLMAVDIILYDATYVPVGDDQSQHLEFARDIAERMNAKFGDLFVVPEPVVKQHQFFGKDQGLRIRDLVDPTKKMSKSDESGKGVIFLSDAPELAKKKVMAATTDSLRSIKYDHAAQPGISNLLDIYTMLGGNKSKFIGQDQYGPLKSAVADKVSEFLSDFQLKLQKVDDHALSQKLELSEKLLKKQANNTLLKVQKAVGLRA
ncbi:MAG: tryptophan--tRNA ligase [Patescibacteria group bacterium]